MAKNAPWIGPPFKKQYQSPFEKGEFYIHQRQQDIGLAINRNQNQIDWPGEASRLTLKRQAFHGVQAQYINLFKESINAQDLQLLSQNFSDVELVEVAQKALNERVKELLPVEEMQKLMQKYISFSSQVNVESILKRDIDAIENFNNYLKILEQSSSLLKTKAGAALAAAIKDAQNSGGSTIGVKSNNLEKALNQAQKDFEGTVFQQQQLSSAIHDIKKLSSFFHDNNLKGRSNKFIAGKMSSADGLIKNLFSTGLGEAVAAQIGLTGIEEIDKVILQTLALTGSNINQGVLYDSQGKVRTGEKGSKASGKADIKKSNLEVAIEVDGKKRIINIDLGISNKFYKNQAFQGINNKKNNSLIFGSGSGGSVHDAIYATFKETRSRYLAYNVFVHSTPGISNLQDIIFTRQIVNLFSSRNGILDFSQIMFINGRLISIYDILKAIENTYIGLSHSQGGAKSQLVTGSIENRAAITGAASIDDERQRVDQAAKGMTKAKIRAELNLKFFNKK